MWILLDIGMQRWVSRSFLCVSHLCWASVCACAQCSKEVAALCAFAAWLAIKIDHETAYIPSMHADRRTGTHVCVRDKKNRIETQIAIIKSQFLRMHPRHFDWCGGCSSSRSDNNIFILYISFSLARSGCLSFRSVLFVCAHVCHSFALSFFLSLILFSYIDNMMTGNAIIYIGAFVR